MALDGRTVPDAVCLQPPNNPALRKYHYFRNIGNILSFIILCLYGSSTCSVEQLWIFSSPVGRLYVCHTPGVICLPSYVMCCMCSQ